jgi:hypothetical protein
MTRGSSINFKKGSAGFEHNDRTEEHEAKHLLPIEHRLENECDRSATESRELLKEMVENAKEKYQERTGQKLQAKIFAVEAAINLEAHHTLKDVEKINEYLEQKHGLRAVQSSIHRDEGHIDDEGKPEYNLHAHVVYCNLDKDGKTVLKGLEKDDFRELQTFVAKTLNMQRGQSAEITKAKHKSPQEFRHEKVLATNKNLKAEIAQLREQFKEQGATRADYAQIEQLQKELKEQIKAKELSEDELHKRISELSQTVDSLQNDLKISRRELELSQKKQSELEISLKNLEDIPQISNEPINTSKIVELQDENKLLKVLNQGLEIELKEAKSATVSTPSVDIEPLREILRTATIIDQSPSDEEIIKRQKEIEDLKSYNGRRIIEASKDLTTMGKITGAKELNEARLERNIDKILNLHLEAHKSGDKIIDKFHRAKEIIIDGAKDVIKRAEIALKTIFPQKTRDLSPTPKKEIVEPNLSDTDKIRGFVDQLKENEKNQSRSMGGGR